VTNAVPCKAVAMFECWMARSSISAIFVKITESSFAEVRSHLGVTGFRAPKEMLKRFYFIILL
jgi:hypothetical protein